MRKRLVPVAAAFAAALLGVALFGQAQDEAAPAAGGAGERAPMNAGAEMNEQERISYAIGYMIGRDLRQRGMAIESPEQFLQGLKDATAGAEAKLTDEQIQQAQLALQRQVRERQAAAAQAQAQGSAAFLEANQAKEGVKTTESGLQYKVIEEGQGTSPAMGDTVVVNYTGRLIDGTVFDASERHGGPAEFKVGQVIEGWNEALQMMKPGAKWELYIPPDLAYGAQGAPPVIPPNAALIFEVELVEVKPQG